MRTIKQDVGVVRVVTRCQLVNGEMVTTLDLYMGHLSVAEITYRNGQFINSVIVINLPLTVQRKCQLPEKQSHNIDFAPERFDIYHMLAWYKLAKTDWFKKNNAAKVAMFNYHYRRMAMYIDEAQSDYDPSQYEYNPK